MRGRLPATLTPACGSAVSRPTSLLGGSLRAASELVKLFVLCSEQSFPYSIAMRDVSLKQLRAVAAIARTGKVLAAAEKIGVTPPAVTLQLRQLENSLGLALFERGRDGMKLTDAGRHLM